MSALRPAFFILYLEFFISRLNEILRHDLTLSVGEPDNAAAQTGAGTSFGATGAPLHEQNPSTYFCALTIRKHLSNLSGQRPSICCRRPRCRLKAPLGLSLLRCAAQTRFHPKPCLERPRRNCVKLTQFLLGPCGSIGEITLGIFQRLFQKFLQLIRIIIHPMVGLRKFNIVVWNVVQNVRSH